MLVQEHEMITGLSGPGLADAELRMLETIAPLTQSSRVEFAAHVSLRQTIHGPLDVGLDNSIHRIWLDSFSDAEMGNFRYEMVGGLVIPKIKVSNYHTADGPEVRQTTEKTMKVGERGGPVLITKTGDMLKDKDVTVEDINVISTQTIFDLLNEVASIAPGTSPWPRTRASGSPMRDNPVLGRNYGCDRPLIDPQEIMPLYGRIVAIGAEALRSAVHSGNTVAAELTAAFDAGKAVYRAKRHEIPATISLWSRNENAVAEFDCSAYTFMNDIAFIRVMLKTREYIGRGQIRRTVHHIWQEGAQLQVRTQVIEGENIRHEERLGGLEVITHLANVVAQVAKKEDIQPES